MKLLINRFLVIGLMLFALSCSKEQSLEGGKLTPPVGENEWSFLDSGGKRISGPIDTAFRVAAGLAESAVFAGPSDDGTGVLFLQIVGPRITPGTYTTDNIVFEYYFNGQLLYKNVPGNDGAFSVLVTSVDSAGYEGTFSGQVYDDLGIMREIKDGKFKATFSEEVNTGLGQLTVWSKQLCTPLSNVEIIVGNQKAFISQTFTTAPTTCGVTGAANFSLPEGTYPVKIICGTDTTSESIDITAGDCIIAELQ